PDRPPALALAPALDGRDPVIGLLVTLDGLFFRPRRLGREFHRRRIPPCQEHSRQDHRHQHATPPPHRLTLLEAARESARAWIVGRPGSSGHEKQQRPHGARGSLTEAPPPESGG